MSCPATNRLRTKPLLVVAVVLAGANLRPAVASVGPVLHEIRLDLGLSGSAAAVLTALPLLAFGTVALLAPTLTRRFGIKATLAITLGTLTAGLLVRIGASPFTLFAGTALIATAIAIANVLLPALVKQEFASHTGLMMGIYVSAVVGAAGLGAGATVPLAAALGRGWRGGLGIWAVPAAVALVFWIVIAKLHNERRMQTAIRMQEPRVSFFRHGLAWQVTAFMGLQGLGFYAVLAWLPSVYRDYGFSPEKAGVLLSIMVIVGVPVALIVPSLATRSTDQRGWAALVTGITALGLLGLLVAPTAAPYAWAVLLGTGLGASFPLALTLVVLRSRQVQDAERLSAMAQSLGYLLAALGPFTFGILHDLSSGWKAPIAMLLILQLPQLMMGLGAGRALHVGQVRD